MFVDSALLGGLKERVGNLHEQTEQIAEDTTGPDEDLCLSSIGIESSESCSSRWQSECVAICLWKNMFDTLRFECLGMSTKAGRNTKAGIDIPVPQKMISPTPLKKASVRL